MKKLLVLLLVLMVAASGFAQITGYKSTKSGGYSVALLDANNNNAWRITFEGNISKKVAEYKASGLVSKYVAFSANNEASVQAQQMEQLVNEGIDLILVNPVSATSLNPIIDRAMQRGVRVIAVDSTVAHPKVLTVTNDQFNYAKLHIEWLLKQINYKGNIIHFNAIKGVPANDERESIYKEYLAKYPEVKVLATEYHGWNASKAKQLMAGLLAAYPNIDAVLTQESTPGIVAAFVEAGRPFPKAISGDESIEGLRTWKKYNYNSLMVENPPAVGVHGLMIGVRLLQGKQLDPAKLKNGNIFMVKQNLIIDQSMRDSWVEKTKGLKDNDYIDSVMTEAQIDSYFLK